MGKCIACDIENDDVDHIWASKAMRKVPDKYHSCKSEEAKMAGPSPKLYTLEEFCGQATLDLDQWEHDWSGEKSNDFHRGKHNWSTWWHSFFSYFNWEER